MRGAYRDRHGRGVRDAVGVSGCSVLSRAGERSDAYGEIVWSWPLGAEVKLARSFDERVGDGGKKADPRGDYV
jgi:hypothetical protein